MAWDWTLDTGSRSVSFGDDNSVIVVDKWGIQPGNLRTDDQANPRADGYRYGQDFRAGQSLEFSMWTNTVGNQEAALAALNDLQSAWRNDGERLRAGSVARLTHPDGKSVVGRPRSFSFNPRMVERGIVQAQAVFECLDDLWYGPQESSVVRFSVPETGGLVFPAETPFTFDSGPTQRNGVLEVAGDVATFPVFKIQGPVTNPSITVTGVGELVFETTLAFDQELVVDCRPWAQWVKRDGASLPGALAARGSRMSDMALLPGTYEVILRGYDPTGTGFLTVQVEPAFTSF